VRTGPLNTRRNNGVSPPSDRWAWIAAVLCMGGLIFTLAGSAMGALLFLAVWGLMAAMRADCCLRSILRSPGLWLVPAFALLSVLWAETPAVTLRAAFELALALGIASLAAGFLRPREFVSTMSVSLMFGRYGVDGMTGAAVFLGIFASKNTMALFMSFLVICATAALADRVQPSPQCLVSAFYFLLSIPLLLMAHSVGAVGTFLVFVIAACGADYVRAAQLGTRESSTLAAGPSWNLLPGGRPRVRA